MCGGGITIWTTVRDLGTYCIWTKICLQDCICLGGVDVGRGMESPFHVLYLMCFCGSWTAPLPNIGSWYVIRVGGNFRLFTLTIKVA